MCNSNKDFLIFNPCLFTSVFIRVQKKWNADFHGYFVNADFFVNLCCLHQCLSVFKKENGTLIFTDIS
jgi:hypothetical protein